MAITKQITETRHICAHPRVWLGSKCPLYDLVTLIGETKLQAHIPIPLSPAAERRPYLSRAFQGAVLDRAPPSLIASQRDARTAAISPIHHAKSYYTFYAVSYADHLGLSSISPASGGVVWKKLCHRTGDIASPLRLRLLPHSTPFLHHPSTPCFLPAACASSLMARSLWRWRTCNAREPS